MKPCSAPTTLKTAPKAVAQAPCAQEGVLVSFRLTEWQAAKLGFQERWEVAVRKREIRAQKKRLATDRLNECVMQLLDRAKSEQWSQRQLASQIAIPETTFRRIRDQKVNAVEWLPKVQTALNRLKTS